MIILWNFLFIVVGILVYAIISGLLANEFHYIACQKGYYSRKYFWICFFLGVIGYLLIVAMPDRKDKVDYARAGQLFGEGNAEEALKLYEELGIYYRDCAVKVKEADLQNDINNLLSMGENDLRSLNCKFESKIYECRKVSSDEIAMSLVGEKILIGGKVCNPYMVNLTKNGGEQTEPGKLFWKEKDGFLFFDCFYDINKKLYMADDSEFNDFSSHCYYLYEVAKGVNAICFAKSIKDNQSRDFLYALLIDKNSIWGRRLLAFEKNMLNR